MANILFFGYNDGVMRRFFTLIITAIILLNASYAAAVTTHSAPMPSLINDFDDNYLEVGNIPADEVNNLLPYLKDKNNLIISAYLTGGNLKNIIHNEYKNYIEIEKLNIGISLDIIVKEK